MKFDGIPAKGIGVDFDDEEWWDAMKANPSFFEGSEPGTFSYKGKWYIAEHFANFGSKRVNINPWKPNKHKRRLRTAM